MSVQMQSITLTPALVAFATSAALAEASRTYDAAPLISVMFVERVESYWPMIPTHIVEVGFEEPPSGPIRIAFAGEAHAAATMATTAVARTSLDPRPHRLDVRPDVERMATCLRITGG